MKRNKLRWGVIGCAGIAVRSVIPAIQQSETGEVTAVASRGGDKARETAEKLGIPKAYDSYERLLEDNEIDAVYIPLPNHLHKEWTIRAAKAGKHVLCEKPFALDAREAEEMAAACAEAGVQLAEAFMYRHHPRYDIIRGMIRSGELGEIRGVRGAFTFNNAGAKENVRFHKEWGGGSLYDVGVYPISAARYLLEAEPEAATVTAFFSPQHDDVDMMAAGLLEFPNNIGVTFDCGMWAAGRNVLEIIGTEARIEVSSAFVSRPDVNSNFTVLTKTDRREIEVPAVNQYTIQADDFARTVWGEQAPRFGASDAVRNMKVIDACLRSARTRTRVLIEP